MRVVNAWYVNQMPNHIVIETPEGELLFFRQTPFRKISKVDLQPYKGHHPAMCAGSLVNPYLLRFYGMEADLTRFWKEWGRYNEAILGYWQGKPVVVVEGHGIAFAHEGDTLFLSNEGGNWYVTVEDTVWSATHESKSEMLDTADLVYESHNDIAQATGLDVGVPS